MASASPVPTLSSNCIPPTGFAQAITDEAKDTPNNLPAPDVGLNPTQDVQEVRLGEQESEGLAEGQSNQVSFCHDKYLIEEADQEIDSFVAYLMNSEQSHDELMTDVAKNMGVAEIDLTGNRTYYNMPNAEISEAALVGVENKPIFEPVSPDASCDQPQALQTITEQAVSAATSGEKQNTPYGSSAEQAARASSSYISDAQQADLHLAYNAEQRVSILARVLAEDVIAPVQNSHASEYIGAPLYYREQTTGFGGGLAQSAAAVDRENFNGISPARGQFADCDHVDVERVLKQHCEKFGGERASADWQQAEQYSKLLLIAHHANMFLYRHLLR